MGPADTINLLVELRPHHTGTVRSISQGDPKPESVDCVRDELTIGFLLRTETVTTQRMRSSLRHSARHVMMTHLETVTPTSVSRAKWQQPCLDYSLGCILLV